MTSTILTHFEPKKSKKVCFLYNSKTKSITDNINQMNISHRKAKSIHLLPGDSLSPVFDKTGIEGKVFICRECFVAGDSSASDLNELFDKRNRYLSKYGDPGFYREHVDQEFRDFREAARGAVVNLWFEYEVFCQVNLWFSINLISGIADEINIVYPKRDYLNSVWDGFAPLNSEQLLDSFENRVALNADDQQLASELWDSFSNERLEEFKHLDSKETEAFPTLLEIGNAIVEIRERPRLILRESIESGRESFDEAFRDFCRIGAIYGFGDIQVKAIYDEEIANR